MGTRVDFYVGRGENAEWLGSYPFDGYPDGVFTDDPQILSMQATETDWRGWVATFLDTNPDRATLPEMGWPWPWETSATTDYAYAWDDHCIYGSHFGHPWFLVVNEPGFGEPSDEEEAGPRAVFPDMTSQSAMTMGPRSGVIVVSMPVPRDGGEQA